MAQFTTGHLNLVAKVLHEQRIDTLHKWSGTAQEHRLEAINETAYALGRAFEESNPRFSMLRFVGAVMNGK